MELTISPNLGKKQQLNCPNMVNSLHKNTRIIPKKDFTTLFPFSNHNEHNDAGSSDHDYRVPYSAVRVRDRDTASESTSGITVF